MSWEKIIDKYLTVFIPVLFTLVLVSLSGGIVGILTAHITMEFTNNSQIIWTISTSIGALAGIGYGWASYKGMTQKRAK